MRGCRRSWAPHWQVRDRLHYSPWCVGIGSEWELLRLQLAYHTQRLRSAISKFGGCD